jgi:hydrogenase nickel incorporation protein HypB
MDLLPHLDFDLALFMANVRQVNPVATVIEVSARTGLGVPHWLAWLMARRATTN